ncbi:hypothetical protein V1525DRAFT_175100 [Lipomyces kononenkoae]|uniref:Uncharacterized protein n=1 Tax=Lipomyces kononenkoae TaxID=34357 RepID=A0ACC3T9K5_LIPKO
MEPTQFATTSNPASTAPGGPEPEWQSPMTVDNSLVHSDGVIIDSTYGIDGLSLRVDVKTSSLEHRNDEEVFDTFFAGPQYEEDSIDDVDRNMLEQVANDNPTNRKIILSAVGKANTAVQLDNDGNIEGAKMAYIEACNLLQIVIKRTDNTEYCANLRKIYEVYCNRVSELNSASASAAWDGSASISASPMQPFAHVQSRHASLSGELAARRSSLAYGQDVGSRISKDSSVPAFRDIFRSQNVEYTGADDVLAASARLHSSTNVRGSSSSMSSASGAVSPLTTMADHGYPSTPSSPPPARLSSADILRTDLRFYDSDSFFEPPSPTISIIGQEQFEHVADVDLLQVEDMVLPVDYLQRDDNGQVIPLGKSVALFHSKTENHVKADISLSQVLQEFDLDVELAKAHFGHPPVRAIVPDTKPLVVSAIDPDNTDAASDNVFKESAASNGLGLYYDSKPVSQDLLTADQDASSVLQPAIDLQQPAGLVQIGENETMSATEPRHIRTPTVHSTASSETGSNASPSRHRRVFSTVPPTDVEVSPTTQPLRRASSVNSSRKSVFALTPTTPTTTATPKSTRVTFLRSISSPAGSVKSSSSRNVTLSLEPVATRVASSPSSSNSFTGAASPASATSFGSQVASGSQFMTSKSSVSLTHISKTGQTPQSTSTSSFATHVPLTPSVAPRQSISTVTRADTIRSQETLPPRPADPIARPFWLMRNLHTALTSPSGGPISARLRLSPQIFLGAGVKLRSLDEKIAACETMSSALLHFEDLRSIQGITDLVRVMDRIETRLQPILVPEGSDYTHGFGAFGDDFFTPTTRKAPPVAAYSSPTSETSSERSVSIASEQSSQKVSGWKKFKSWAGSGSKDSASRASSSSRAQSDAGAIPQKDSPGMDSDEMLQGPLRRYINALVVLFYRAQIIEQIPDLLSADKLPAKTKARVDLAVRRGSEFFGQVICKFVLADIRELMDRYVKKNIRAAMGA